MKWDAKVVTTSIMEQTVQCKTEWENLKSSELFLFTVNATNRPIIVPTMTWWGKCVAINTLDNETRERIARSMLQIVVVIMNLLKKCAWHKVSFSEFISHRTTKHSTADVTIEWPDGDPVEKRMQDVLNVRKQRFRCYLCPASLAAILRLSRNSPSPTTAAVAGEGSVAWQHQYGSQWD